MLRQQVRIALVCAGLDVWGQSRKRQGIGGLECPREENAGRVLDSDGDGGQWPVIALGNLGAQFCDEDEFIADLAINECVCMGELAVGGGLTMTFVFNSATTMESLCILSRSVSATHLPEKASS
jgi:hypothetical protein